MDGRIYNVQYRMSTKKRLKPIKTAGNCTSANPKFHFILGDGRASLANSRVKGLRYVRFFVPIHPRPLPHFQTPGSVAGG